ncbi:hypothetical protein C8J56DRAFT_978547 [Mycena floridula]|nr:hypothetical protein C8J56DRAFT_978547 [Mycena floridula]
MSYTIPIIAIFQYSLQPIAPFTWFGLNVSTLDMVATVRLCVILRQIKDMLHKQHVDVNGHDTVESRSFVRSFLTTLIVVYGGEAVTAPFLGVPPSFMVSGTFPGLYAAVQAVVDLAPNVPFPSLQSELPLSIVDGFTRAYLLCNLIPPAVIANASQPISSSPWTLLVSSFLIANGGFFFANLFSFLNPTPLALQTPPELQAYGWTTADLWCAPMITGLYAFLTHAQPFWADAHNMVSELLGGTVASVSEKGIPPLDPEVARAVCTMVLVNVFIARTVKNFSAPAAIKPVQKKRDPSKLKTQ